ncbi:ubiquinol-cytochrome c reductase iron-sulfur subunit [Zobellia alginiliquefaciens]|uniref:QcrA and Rieske domain-containing protein n=1 Tax=Zobellia alginiliquefaciens TaxID=3032586 RepID=UPI0023E44978|nr:Rieske 2Fe-2S domain-containing protein [Zobellia alginiliquefaciens]
MERKHFLKTLGASAAFALAFPCLHGCSSDSGDNIEGEGNTPVPTGIDFTLDLEASENAKLAENGGFIVKDLVVVAKNLEGEFVAASQVCSHQGYEEVRFASINGGIFYCDVHNSRFEQNGTPINQVDSAAPKALKVFKTELNGNMLRIFE